MSEEKKSIDNLQGQEANTDEVKGGFKGKHLKSIKKGKTSDGDYLLEKKLHKGREQEEAGEIEIKKGVDFHNPIQNRRR